MSKETNVFEIATRKKYRFPFKGMITVEDLWDLSLQNLDSVYKSLNKLKKDSDEDSLLSVESRENKELEDKINIIKYIVKVKQDEAAAKLFEKERAERNQQILGIIKRKEDAALENMSIEELTKMLDQ